MMYCLRKSTFEMENLEKKVKLIEYLGHLCPIALEVEGIALQVGWSDGSNVVQYFLPFVRLAVTNNAAYK